MASPSSKEKRNFIRDFNTVLKEIKIGFECELKTELETHHQLWNRNSNVISWTWMTMNSQSVHWRGIHFVATKTYCLTAGSFGPKCNYTEKDDFKAVSLNDVRVKFINVNRNVGNVVFGALTPFSTMVFLHLPTWRLKLDTNSNAMPIWDVHRLQQNLEWNLLNLWFHKTATSFSLMRDKLNIKLLFQASCVGDWERASFMDVGREQQKQFKNLGGAGQLVFAYYAVDKGKREAYPKPCRPS